MKKNIKLRFLRKLKTIPTPTWNHPPFQTSNLHKEHKNHSLHQPISMLSETSMDAKPEGIVAHPKVKQNGAVSTNDREENQEKPSPLSGHQHRCPPGGKDAVVVYTTSLRGIRKTFEDCNTVRFLLESFRVVYSERDVSMHMEYRDEMWKVLEGRVVPPRVFIRGRYIGGADEVVGLHEKGMLKNLLQGIPLSLARVPCRGCGGVRFVLCSSCNGSRKVAAEGGGDGVTLIRCTHCNENGLVKCSICSMF